jgi:hypothetical protein
MTEEPVNDNIIHVATIRSLVHRQTKGLAIGDEGFYELEVHVDLTKSKGDNLGYIRHMIAQHLAQCAETTNVPMYEGLWLVQFSPWAQKELNVAPSFLI